MTASEFLEKLAKDVEVSGLTPTLGKDNSLNLEIRNFVIKKGGLNNMFYLHIENVPYLENLEQKETWIFQETTETGMFYMCYQGNTLIRPGDFVPASGRLYAAVKRLGGSLENKAA